MNKRGSVRTIRFSEQDWKDIEAFLAKNPIFDFSSLARLAIRNFIERPKLEVRGIRPASDNSKKGAEYEA